jgi:hypothetical protein
MAFHLSLDQDHLEFKEIICLFRDKMTEISWFKEENKLITVT